jgi:hypothetical protein
MGILSSKKMSFCFEIHLARIADYLVFAETGSRRPGRGDRVAETGSRRPGRGDRVAETGVSKAMSVITPTIADRNTQAFT